MNANYEFCLTGNYTDVGRVRKANEDNMGCFDTPNGKAVIVCDGMGGHVGGQIASQTAITAIHDFLINNVFPDPREAIYHAVTAANTAILNRAQAQPELSGMGSTCVMLIITADGKVYYGHVGDSRIYIVANRQIRQLTKDHSYVQMLVDAGQISKEQAEHHPRKNEITNALGLQGMQPPTVCNEPIEPEAGNCFLLCSDGLTGMVNDTHIERVVSNRNLKIQQRAEKLVQMANEAGGVDNITVQLVEFALGAQDISNTKKGGKKSLKKLMVYVIPVLLILGGAATWWFFMKEKEKPHKEEEKNVFIRKDKDSIQIPKTLAFTKEATTNNILVSNDSIINIIRIVKKYEDLFTAKLKDNQTIEIEWTAWNKSIDFDTIELLCETKTVKELLIKIPISIPELQKPGVAFTPSPGLKTSQNNDTVTINLKIEFKLEKPNDSIYIASLELPSDFPADKLERGTNSRMRASLSAIKTNYNFITCDKVGEKNELSFTCESSKILTVDSIVLTTEKVKSKFHKIIIKVKVAKLATSVHNL
jgi:protein phosphatase